MSYARVVQRNALVYKRTWKSGLLFSFFTPLLFLSAFGLGVGAIVNRGQTDAFNGATYLQFLSSGLLAANLMQAASFSMSWPIMGKFSWQRNYEAMLSTPLQVKDLVLGELAWLATFLGMSGGAYLIVLAIFRVPTAPVAVLALPAAMFMGLGYGAWIGSYTATRQNENGFNGLFRFVITPMFLFSGTFFNPDSIHGAIQVFMNVIPLYHGLKLVRSFVMPDHFGLSPLAFMWHFGYLLVFFATGTWMMMRTFTNRLIK